MARDHSPALPGKVSVRFETLRCAGQPSDSVPAEYVKVVALADVQSALGVPGLPASLAGAPGTRPFNDSALALYNPPGANPTNKTVLDDLATAIATDFYRWRAVSFDHVYNGVLAPTPNGLYDTVEWAYDASECSTRIMSAPVGAERDEFLHGDPAIAACVDNLTANPPVIVEKTLFGRKAAEMYSPPATAPSGETVFQVFLRGLHGGRLVEKWLRTEVLPCGCGCTRTITVRGCTSTVGGSGGTNAIAAAPVSVSGTTSASGTTDTAGAVTFALPSGSYTVSIPALGGFAAYSAPFTVDCATSSATVPVTLSPDADHVCTSCCVYPIPKTLNGSYAGYSFTLTYNPATAAWEASGTMTVSLVSTSGAGGTPPCIDDGTTLNVTYKLFCSGGTSWSFVLGWRFILCYDPPFGTPGFSQVSRFTNDTGPDTFNQATTVADSQAAAPCRPFFYQFVLPTNGQPTTPGGGGVANPVVITQ